MTLSSKSKTILLTFGVLVIVTAGIMAYVFVFEEDSFTAVLEEEGVLIDEVKEDIISTVKQLEPKVEAGEMTDDEMKRQVQQTLAQALRVLVQEDAITQEEMTDQLQTYVEAAGGGFDTSSPQDLAAFCERMAGRGTFGGARPEGFSGPTGGTRQMPSSSFDFTQMQAVMSEMQSLCNDDVYTDAEIQRYQQLQAQLPQRGQGGFIR